MEDDIKPQRGMVIVAHPDDAEWGCSGTVAKWCREGMDVVYVICTNGNKGTDVPEINNRQLAEMRRQEQRDAADVLGVRDVIFLDYEDAMLTPSLELRKDISREIRRHRPDVLIAPCPIRSFDHGDYIGHPDHIAVGEATLSAVYPAARDRLTFPELLDEGFEPHKVTQLLVMDRGDDANTVIDVSETIETAIEALKQHRSQVRPEDAEKYMRMWRSENGKTRGLEYAEVYRGFNIRD